MIEVLAEVQPPAAPANNYPSSPYGNNNTSRRDTPATPVEGGAGSGSSIYAVGDNVLARWTSGDNQLYPARITSVMGSQKNPVYIVKFTQYNATETLHPQHIKPANNANKKRKLENEPTNNASTTPTSNSNGAIISQPATINAELAEANKRKSTETLDGPQKPAKAGRKIAQNKVLEDGKKKWQNFAQKGVKGKVGKAKKIGESSMFRTPDGVHGRGTYDSRLTLLSQGVYSCKFHRLTVDSWVHGLWSAYAERCDERKAHLPTRGGRRIDG